MFQFCHLVWYGVTAILPALLPTMLTQDERTSIAKLKELMLSRPDIINPVKALFASGFASREISRVSYVDYMSLRGILAAVQRVYLYKVATASMKKGATLDDDEIRALAAQSYIIAERAIRDYAECIKQIYNSISTPSFCHDVKRIEVTDQVFEITYEFNMLQYIITIAPPENTVHMQEVMPYVVNMHKIRHKALDDCLPLLKVQMIVEKDAVNLLNAALAEDPWNRISPDLVTEQAGLIYADSTASIEIYEAEHGKIQFDANKQI